MQVMGRIALWGMLFSGSAAQPGVQAVQARASEPPQTSNRIGLKDAGAKSSTTRMNGMKTDKQGPDSTASPESTGNVFSRMIPPPVSRDALTIIEHYCRLRAIGPLGPNRVRLFQQPMGFVGQAVEVDLSSRNMTVYPGTHAKQHVFHGTLSSRQVDLLRALLTSDELSRAPADASQAASFDGASYVLELSLADKYAWFLHRDPKDFWLIEVIRHIEALAWEAQHPGTRFLVR